MTTESRPVWARWGGGGITFAATLLLLATVVEGVLHAQNTAFWEALFGVLLLGSAAAYALAMVPLALGSTGENGIVGRSVAGKLGLLGFGATFLAAEVLYYDVHYLLQPAAGSAGSDLLALALGVAQLLLLLIGAIAAFRAGVAAGTARWSLLAVTVIAAVTGAVFQGTNDAAIGTIAHLISTVAQICFGLAIAFGQNTRLTPQPA